jgi:CheY-like chemotaxis protein
VVDHGEAALDRVAAQTPDLVLVGVEAGALDGFEVCRRIAGEPRTAHVPVLIVSPVSGQGLERKALEAGGELLTPPESRHLLALRLRAALGRKRLTDAQEARFQHEQQHQLAREALVRVSLLDLDVMVTAAHRATLLLADNTLAGLAPEDARCVRVALGELGSAVDTLRALEAVRALDAGEWHFEPAPCDLTLVVAQAAEAAAASAGHDQPVSGTVEPGLELVADAALLEYALAAMVQQTLGRAEPGSAVEIVVHRREPSGVVCEVRQTAGGLDEAQARPAIAQALQLTLARMVAEAHGGHLRQGEAGLVLELPPEPTARQWPPSGVFSRGGPAAGAPAPSAATAAAEWLGSRTVLPAPPRPPRLLPPAPD